MYKHLLCPSVKSHALYSCTCSLSHMTCMIFHFNLWLIHAECLSLRKPVVLKPPVLTACRQWLFCCQTHQCLPSPNSLGSDPSVFLLPFPEYALGAMLCRHLCHVITWRVNQIESLVSRETMGPMYLHFQVFRRTWLPLSDCVLSKEAWGRVCSFLQRLKTLVFVFLVLW